MQGPLAYRSRPVDGPAENFLTLTEVAAYLRLSKKSVQRLIADGKFPRPKQVSKGTAYWLWIDVVAYAEWAGRLEPGPLPDD